MRVYGYKIGTIDDQDRVGDVADAMATFTVDGVSSSLLLAKVCAFKRALSFDGDKSCEEWQQFNGQWYAECNGFACVVTELNVDAEPEL